METRIRHLKLYRAAFKGDWRVADYIYRAHPNEISARITKERDTALHISVSAEHIAFVKKLAKKMNLYDLAMKNADGNTAFFLAAATGNVELAQVIASSNLNLVVHEIHDGIFRPDVLSYSVEMIRNNDGKLPLHMAAYLGHRNMVRYLYRITTDVMSDDDRTQLFVTLINSDIYDVALNLLEEHPELATARDENGETGLHALARKPATSTNFTKQSQQGILKGCLNLLLGTNTVQNKKMHPEAVTLVERIWQQVILSGDLEISELIEKPWRLLFVAARQGNVDFLKILIYEYPGLILKVDENNRSIFHYAVLYRQDEIFKLIYEIGSFKDFISTFRDREDNNILHLAGMLAPPDRLSIVSGEALQLQRELLWFKEVNKVVHPLYAEAENYDGKTPRDLFNAEHMKLMAVGEKWIKETANSCMLVATLITSVVFTATFTVPTDNKRGAGVPVFIQKVSFAISLISSTTSIITFLSLYTSGYKEEDYLFRLPAKFAAGLLTLSTSIAAMIVIFCSFFFIVFDHEMLVFVITVSVIASVPLILFLRQQSLLLLHVIRSTYMSSSLFHSSKRTLFYREWRATERKKTELLDILVTICRLIKELF
ncbi:uncharacterized protein LOC116115895 isoform X2 [Pistacia vera]|uniref:uncharacterized protein LOC116115895 isoform X2 n=1 Tax=Pistacia vera TaxID=55513 RepID=UPI001263CF5C|nr:uncharacterized protein LOC116115895 isoform X2 [Pistacia vera]